MEVSYDYVVILFIVFLIMGDNTVSIFSEKLSVWSLKVGAWRE